MRNLHIDALRLIAFMMVILMHSPLPNACDNGLILSGLSYLTAPCIGIFFMISGALILKNTDIASFSSKEFLRIRITKVLFPMLFWSIIGYALSFCGFSNAENGILWFMYVLIGLYLLSPILIRWLNFASKREVEFYLLLWAISLCYPYISATFQIFIGVTSWLYYFAGYAGYYVLGYYLNNYGLSKRYLCGVWVLFSLFSVGLPILTRVLHWNVNFYSWFWYLSLSVALMCIMWWLLIQKCTPLFERFRPIITELSKLSFGIYLVHILIMRNFLWTLDWMQSLTGLSQIVVCAFLTFVISAAICWCISKLRFSKYIIGI